MPFGLKNAAKTFQRMMDRIFKGIPFCFVYLDDILIASKCKTEHMEHLRVVLELLDQHGLTINIEKCVFGKPEVDYLGHTVSRAGLIPMKRHVTALQDFPPPQDIRQLQRFLGLNNFYRRFLPGIAGILRPLTDALAGKPKLLVWNEEMEQAFCQEKTMLISAVPLVHPNTTAKISMAVDASATHMGAVLQQLDKGGWRPLAFFSKKLSSPQIKYSAFDRELLAVLTAIRHFRFILEEQQFKLFTDHKPLVSALTRVSPPWSARQQRQL